MLQCEQLALTHLQQYDKKRYLHLITKSEHYNISSLYDKLNLQRLDAQKATNATSPLPFLSPPSPSPAAATEHALESIGHTDSFTSLLSLDTLAIPGIESASMQYMTDWQEELPTPGKESPSMQYMTDWLNSELS